MSDNTVALTDMKRAGLCPDSQQNHAPDLPNGISTDFRCDFNQVTEFNSITSSPVTHQESVSTDEDSSDSHRRGSSENGTDITVPDADQRPDVKSKVNTPVDKRTEKRRMKRFRLTHNQTRYLMSEFTRQAHPDAAHRERLSREIPGLSPRQVQVWFQNRRAKLKRLTSDDRERMLRSRALPDDFDMAQALHSPYGNCPPPTSAPLPSPGGYHQESGVMPTSPLVAGNFKAYTDEYATSPLSTASSWNTYFPPHRIHAAGRESPPTHPSEASSPGQYMRPSSFPNSSQPLQSPIQRLQLDDAATRARTVSLSSPHPNGLYTSAPLNRSGSLPSSDLAKRCDSPLHTPPSPNPVDCKRDIHPLERQEPTSSPRKDTGAPYMLLPALQTKPGGKDAKPAVQGSLTPIPNGCGPSPLDSHFNSQPFGIPYAPHLISNLSLPHSQLFFDQNEKHSEEYGSFTNVANGLPDSFLDQSRSYEPAFQFAGAQ